MIVYITSYHPNPEIEKYIIERFNCGMSNQKTDIDSKYISEMVQTIIDDGKYNCMLMQHTEKNYYTLFVDNGFFRQR